MAVEASTEPNYDGPYGVKFDRQEHRHLNNTGYKAVIPYTFDGANVVPVPTGLISASYDYIDLSPSSAAPTSITFKSGGSSGTVVATLNLSYSGSDITSITRV